MSMAWIGAGLSVAGLATNIIGQNQQKKANARAQDANARLQDEQNRNVWANWLMTRGIAPTTSVEPGVLPAEGQYRVTNTRLPLWATINLPPRAPQRGGFLVPRTA